MTYEPKKDSCDARQSLHHVPHSERIEAHATELANRALGLKPPIAFIGAGASMAYGRISWRDAVIAMQDEVLERAEGTKEPTCVRLRELLKQVQLKIGTNAESGDFLVTFQLAEQLDKALRANPGSDSNSGDFRRRLAELLRDDLGHAQHMLDSVIRSFRLETKPTLRRLNSTGETKGSDFRSVEFLKLVADHIRRNGSMPLDTRVDALLNLLTNFGFGEATKQDPESSTTQSPDTSKGQAPDGRLLRPYHRFVTGAALRLLPRDQFYACLGYDETTNTWRPDAPVLPDTPGPDELPRERDPLWLLRACDISRFLTTNYDHEIDRCLTREGLVSEHESYVVPTSGPGFTRKLARHWRSWVFDRNHVGQLLAFAASSGRKLVEVFHLHGRADSDQKLIVTNADYQHHYLSLDDQRAGMDDALSAAFGGNAMLFVGSGMGEDDLLRPLRQFVGEHVPRSRRIAIAIVPGNKADERQVALEKLRNLQRYGVYTIHTGNAGFDTPSDANPRRWLTRLTDLRHRLHAVLSADDETAYKAACYEVVQLLAAAFPNQDPLLAPDSLEGVSTKEHPGLNLVWEVQLINQIVQFVREDASPRDGQKLVATALNTETLRPVLQTALEGCMDSIIGAFLCARLIRMKTDSSSYVSNSLKIPEPEAPEHVVGRATARPEHEALWVRHGTFLRDKDAPPPPPEMPPPLDMGHPECPRFVRGAPSQTFNHLLEALKNLPCPPTGRRLLFLIGDRGVGKGHFFHSLSYPPQLTSLRQALGNTSGPSWPAIFFNCTVSHELTSVFDFLPELLLEAAEIILNAPRIDGAPERLDALKKLRDACSELRRDRLRHLERVLRSLTSLLPPRTRIIVAFNGISVMFDRNGAAKNAQIRRLFDLLLFKGPADPPTAEPLAEPINPPIDLLLVADEDRLPRPLPRVLMELRPLRVSERRAHELEQRSRRLRTKRLDFATAASREHQAFVHSLTTTRACVMVTVYFPSVALVIALTAAFGSLKNGDAKTLGFEASLDQWLAKVPKTQTAAAIRRQVRDLLDRGGASAPPPSPDEVKDRFPRLLGYMVLYTALGHEDWRNEINTIWQAASGASPPTVRPTWWIDYKHPVFIRISNAIDHRMRDLFAVCARSRYGFTVLMSTALQHLADSPHPLRATTCARFLSGAQSRLERIPEHRRVETIFQIAIEELAELDRNRRSAVAPQQLDKLAKCNDLFGFQKTILWELAVIGQPVIAEVLARSPAILRCSKAFVEFCDRSVWETEVTLDKWIKAVEQCLDLLEDRCLVFRIRARDPSDDKQPRYTVHAQLQMHVFRHLHAPFVEYPEADQFALTLAAHHPNDVPRLTTEAHQDLYATISALIDCPQESSLIERPPIRTWPDVAVRPAGHTQEISQKDRHGLDIQAHLLRSALGIVRSVFSVPTVVRFIPDVSGSMTGGPAIQDSRRSSDAPLLERHRFLIHWMIRQAGLHDEAIENWGLDPAKKTEPLVRKPFYREELVWLYNETGVLSYAQGRMLDAKVMFHLAEMAAEKIEPDKNGALHVRIALNTALVDVERGRLALAERAILRILNVEKEDPGKEDSSVLQLATGFLGLVEHVRGRYASAREYYNIALLGNPMPVPAAQSVSPDTLKVHHHRPGLLALRCTRAASIISRFHGDLLRALGEFDNADTMLRQSAMLAIEAGHEDIRHRARLSTLKLEMTRNDAAQGQYGTLDGRHIHRELDIVEDYASHMGNFRLQCEVDLLRASLRQADGDLQAAASVASRGLTQASANDLNLRKTNFLLRLAYIFERRDKIDECKAVLSEAFDLAREAEYHSAREQGQALFARIRGRQSI